MKAHGKMVVWPANIDSVKSRKQGRKIAKSLCVQGPKADEITEAAKRLSIDAELLPAKARPRFWWEKAGYLLVQKKEGKINALRSLASEVRKVRASRAVNEKERK